MSSTRNWFPSVRRALLALGVAGALATPAAGQDVTAVKSNSVGGSALVDTPWTWTIVVTNEGAAGLTLPLGFPFLVDDLPLSDVSYGAPSDTSTQAGFAGALNCSISATDAVSTPGRLLCDSADSLTLNAGESFTVSFTVTATATGSYVNPRSGQLCRANPTGFGGETNTGNNDCQDTVTVGTGATDPDLVVVKSNDVSGSTTMADGAFGWALQVTNIGSSAASFSNGQNLLLDQLPNSNITYGTPSVGSMSGVTGSVSCQIASFNLTCSAVGAVSLADGGTFTVSFDAMPTQGATFANPRAGGTCAVDPNGVVAEDDEGNNDCGDTVSVSDSPDLTATKQNNVSGEAVVGEAFTWSIQVQNVGNAAATVADPWVFLTDVLPDQNIAYGTPQISSSSGLSGAVNCSISDFVLLCGPTTSASLGAGGQFTVSFTATADAAGTFDNPRQVNGCSADPGSQVSEVDEGNNLCSDTVLVTTGTVGPDLTATKMDDVGSLTEIGAGPFTWSIDVTNGGDEEAIFPADAVLLRDDLPASDLAYGTPIITSSMGIGGAGSLSCSVSTNTLTCSAVGGTVTLAAGTGSFTVELDATPSAAGTFVNPRGGGVCSADPDDVEEEGDEANNGCSDSTAVTSSPDAIATKSNDAPPLGASVGVPFTWSIRVQNVGGAEFVIPSGQIVLGDNLPTSGLTYGAPTVVSEVSVAGNIGCSIDGTSNLVCTADTAVGVSAGGEFTVQFTATPTVEDTFVNPREGGVCAVDPAAVEVEEDESNNDCEDVVDLALFADGFETGNTSAWQ